MTKEELIELIDSWENLPYLINEIALNHDFYKVLMDLALYNPNRKSWRAAYLVDKINDIFPELLNPFLNEMIEQVKIEKNESKRRHFLKLLSMNKLSQMQEGLILDFCINTFTSAKEPVAVRVHAMQVLFNIAQSEPELQTEILAIIEHELENHATAGISSRGKKLAQKLRLNKNAKVGNSGIYK